ncbi:hypothetical protein QLR68_32460, partial [Micromonospora sp. DH15]|nr:hypothetical protein [Micromonospora sp. DH15]
AHGAAPTPALLAAARSGRPADLLLVTAPDAPLRPALDAAGFPLVAEVDLLAAPTPPGSAGDEGLRLAFATGSDRSLQAFKDALWAADGPTGVRYRDPADPQGRAVDVGPEADPGPLGRELLAELARGPRTVTELRRFALTSTVYRAADANRAVADLLDAGAVARDPEYGKLGGDVLISAVRPGGPAA